GAGSNVPGLPTYPGTLPAGSASPAASGAPVASPTPAASAPATSATGYDKHQETVNYANSQTIEKIVQQPGAIERLSAAALLDDNAAKNASAQSLQAAISAAIGADTARGDVVTVSSVPFAAPTASGGPDAVGGLAETAGGALGSVGGALLAG